MLAPNLKLSSDHPDHAIAAHRARVEECRSLLDPAISLGTIALPANECAAIERYYRAKARRGEVGAYWLHQVQTLKRPLRELRRGK